MKVGYPLLPMHNLMANQVVPQINMQAEYASHTPICGDDFTGGATVSMTADCDSWRVTTFFLGKHIYCNLTGSHRETV